MKDLQKYVAECEADLKSIGIKQGTVKEWIINTRASSWLGKCRKLPDGSYQISIIEALLFDEVQDKVLKNTIMHELLHTVEGSMKHTGRWLLNAQSVNKRLPNYNIKRTNELPKIDRNSTQYQYAVKCVCCGGIYYRTKMSNIIKNPERYRCGVCHGELKRIDL